MVEEAVSVIKDAQARLDQVYAEYADPDADFDKLAAEQAKLEAILQAGDGIVDGCSVSLETFAAGPFQQPVQEGAGIWPSRETVDIAAGE